MTSWPPTVSVYKVYILQIQFHASVVAHRSDVLYQCCDVSCPIHQLTICHNLS